MSNSLTSGRPEAAVAELMRHLAALEQDCLQLKADLRQLESKGAAAEEAATAAVQRGDDASARAQLLQVERCSEEASVILAQISIIEATLESYGKALAEVAPNQVKISSSPVEG